MLIAYYFHNEKTVQHNIKLIHSTHTSDTVKIERPIRSTGFPPTLNGIDALQSRRPLEA
jgi:hypothetical protein